MSPSLLGPILYGHWGPLVEGDILDAGALDAAFARLAVVHFAALNGELACSSTPSDLGLVEIGVPAEAWRNRRRTNHEVAG